MAYAITQFPEVRDLSSFHYVMTELCHLTPEKLQFLANFFEIQAAKYGIAVERARMISQGLLASGIVLFATGFTLHNTKVKAGLFGSGVALFFFGCLSSVIQSTIESLQNAEIEWQQRCIELIQLSKETG